jgi:hypothetical protein
MTMSVGKGGLGVGGRSLFGPGARRFPRVKVTVKPRCQVG